MKKYVTISLFIFWAVVVALLVAGLLAYNKNSQPVSGSNASGTPQITGTDPKAASLTLSSAELAKHNSGQSCWLLISGKIYDVTSFINSHPGGRAEILGSCGKDATVAYDTRGGTGSHSGRANAMLADYYIGDLNQTVVTTPTNSTVQTSVNPTPNLPRSRENEEEDD